MDQFADHYLQTIIDKLNIIIFLDNSDLLTNDDAH